MEERGQPVLTGRMRGQDSTRTPPKAERALDPGGPRGDAGRGERAAVEAAGEAVPGEALRVDVEQDGGVLDQERRRRLVGGDAQEEAGARDAAGDPGPVATLPVRRASTSSTAGGRGTTAPRRMPTVAASAAASRPRNVEPTSWPVGASASWKRSFVRGVSTAKAPEAARLGAIITSPVTLRLSGTGATRRRARRGRAPGRSPRPRRRARPAARPRRGRRRGRGPTRRSGRVCIAAEVLVAEAAAVDVDGGAHGVEAERRRRRARAAAEEDGGRETRPRTASAARAPCAARLRSITVSGPGATSPVERPSARTLPRARRPVIREPSARPAASIASASATRVRAPARTTSPVKAPAACWTAAVIDSARSPAAGWPSRGAAPAGGASPLAMRPSRCAPAGGASPVSRPSRSVAPRGRRRARRRVRSRAAHPSARVQGPGEPARRGGLAGGELDVDGHRARADHRSQRDQPRRERQLAERHAGARAPRRRAPRRS